MSDHEEYKKLIAFDVASPHRQMHNDHWSGKLLQVEFFENIRSTLTVSGLKGRQILCKVTLPTGVVYEGRALWADERKYDKLHRVILHDEKLSFSYEKGMKIALSRCLKPGLGKASKEQIWKAFFLFTKNFDSMWYDYYGLYEEIR